LTNIPTASRIPTILLFDLSTIHSLPCDDPIHLSTTAQRWNNCKRSSSPPPPFDFLRITETTPETYLQSTPTDILHKLWHSNLVPNNTTVNVWPSAIWQKTIPYYDLLPIQKALSPNYYNCETNKVAIIAPYSLDSDQTEFAPLLPATRCVIPSISTIITCSLHIIRRPNMSMMTEIPPSTTNGTPTDPSQSDWYYVPKYQHEHLRTDLLPFHWYTGLQTTPTAALPKYYTDHSPWDPLTQLQPLLLHHSYWQRGTGNYTYDVPTRFLTATVHDPFQPLTRLKFYSKIVSFLNEASSLAYLPALTTKFRGWIRLWHRPAWSSSQYRTVPPRPATSDKNLLRPP